jgi:hypothetical protein
MHPITPGLHILPRRVRLARLGRLWAGLGRLWAAGLPAAAIYLTPF